MKLFSKLVLIFLSINSLSIQSSELFPSQYEYNGKIIIKMRTKNKHYLSIMGDYDFGVGCGGFCKRTRNDEDREITYTCQPAIEPNKIAAEEFLLKGTTSSNVCAYISNPESFTEYVFEYNEKSDNPRPEEDGYDDHLRRIVKYNKVKLVLNNEKGIGINLLNPIIELSNNAIYYVTVTDDAIEILNEEQYIEQEKSGSEVGDSKTQEDKA